MIATTESHIGQFDLDPNNRSDSAPLAPIRTLFVSTTYPRDTADWRGTFIANISSALARRTDILLSQWAPPGDVATGVQLVTTTQESAWLGRLMELGGISHWLRSKPMTGFPAALRLLHMLYSMYRRSNNVDLYHINWLQCALPLPKDGKPALITVLGNDMQLLRMPGMRHALRRSLSGRKAYICPNATWMVPPLKELFGDCASIACIPFGIDPRWYAVERKIQQPPVWLAVTRLTANKLGPLLEWSQPLFEEGVRQLHLFGPMQETIELPQWIHYHGPATPEQLVTEWFPRAQGLISLSQHAEGRPQVMLEAMAAGLPIIASQLPAHSDLITHDRTGLLCASQQEYADALAELEQHEANSRIGAAAREWVMQELGTWDDCAARYAHIYRQLQE